MQDSSWCVIILAAGKGKRMKSDLPKVVHEVAGVPMVVRVCNASEAVSSDIIVVVGHKAEAVKESLSEFQNISFAVQAEQKGTGHAVKSAVKNISADVDHVLVLCGDTPLIKGRSLEEFSNHHCLSGKNVSVLAMEVENPDGYGRIVINDSRFVEKIVEHADANDEEKKINIVNSGIYCFKKDFLLKGLEKLDCKNSQDEYYLTDLIGFAYEDSKESVGFHLLENSMEAMGVNSPEELEKAQSLLMAKASVA